MSLPQLILDTDVLSALMRSNPVVMTRSRSYLGQHGQFTLSIITRYEILRGLKAKGATRQAVAFDRFCEKNRILPITADVVERASEIYADLYKRGELLSDADILIAATAIVARVAAVNQARKVKALMQAQAVISRSERNLIRPMMQMAANRESQTNQKSPAAKKGMVIQMVSRTAAHLTLSRGLTQRLYLLTRIILLVLTNRMGHLKLRLTCRMILTR